MNIILTILTLICIVYLAGVAFTVIFLMYVDYKSESLGLKLRNPHIIIPSLFWIAYWHRYFTVKKLLKELLKMRGLVKDGQPKDKEED